MSSRKQTTKATLSKDYVKKPGGMKEKGQLQHALKQYARHRAQAPARPDGVEMASKGYECEFDDVDGLPLPVRSKQQSGLVGQKRKEMDSPFVTQAEMFYSANVEYSLYYGSFPVAQQQAGSIEGGGARGAVSHVCCPARPSTPDNFEPVPALCPDQFLSYDNDPVAHAAWLYKEWIGRVLDEMGLVVLPAPQSLGSVVFTREDSVDEIYESLRQYLPPLPTYEEFQSIDWPQRDLAESQGPFILPAMIAGGLVVVGCQKVARAIAHATDELKGETAEFRKLIEETSKRAGSALSDQWERLMGILQAAWKPIVASVCLVLVACTPVGGAIRSALRTVLQAFLGVKEATLVEQQAGVLNDSVVTTAFLAKITSTFLPDCMAKEVAGEYERSISTYGKWITWDKMTPNTLMDYLRNFLSWLGERLNLDFLKKLAGKPALAQVWLKDCRAFLTKWNADMLDFSPADVLHYTNLQQMGTDLLVTVDRLPIKNDVSRVLGDLMAFGRSHAAHIASIRGQRIQPVAPMLSGPPGCGKSFMISRFALRLAVEMCKRHPDLFPKERVFEVFDPARKAYKLFDFAGITWTKGKTKHADGYVNQMFTLIDDFLQAKNMPGGEMDDAKFVIDAVSNNPFPLPAASLSEKGSLLFNSIALFLTTNANSSQMFEKFCMETVHSEDAVRRRIDWFGIDQVRPEYRLPDGQLDHVRVEREFVETGRFPDCWLMSFLPYKKDFNQIVTVEGAYEMILAHLDRNVLLFKNSRGQGREVAMRLGEDLAASLAAGALDQQAGEIHSFPFGPVVESDDDVGVRGLEASYNATFLHSPTSSFATQMEEEATRLVEKKGVWNCLIEWYGRAWVIVKKHWRIIACVGGLLVGFTALSSFFSTRSPLEEQSVKLSVRQENFLRNQVVVSLTTAPDVNGLCEDLDFGYGMFVEQDKVLMPSHFLRLMKEYAQVHGAEATVDLTFSNGHVVSWPVGIYVRADFRHSEGDDMVVIKLPQARSGIRSMVSAFVSEELLRSNKVRPGNFYTSLAIAKDSLGRKGALVVTDNLHGNVVKREEVVGCQSLLNPRETYVLRRYLYVHTPGAKAQCGRLYLYSGPNAQVEDVIIGAHVAGRSSKQGSFSFAGIVTQEWLRSACQELALKPLHPEVKAHISPAAVEQSGEMRSVLQTLSPGAVDELKRRGQFGPLARDLVAIAEKPQWQYDPQTAARFGCQVVFPISGGLPVTTKTRLRPSLLFDFGRHKKIPARITPDNLVKAAAKYTEPAGVPDPAILDRAARILKSRLFPELDRVIGEGIEKRLLTFEETVLGNGQLKPIPYGSSPGLPFTALGFKKEDLFKADGQVDLSKAKTEELRSIFEVLDDRMEEDGMPCVFSDFAKDEKLPYEKVVDEGKVRMIMGCGLLYTLMFRRYFGAFQAAVFASHLKQGMAPGINTYTEWDALARLLGGNSSQGTLPIVAGDFSRYDATQNPLFHEKICEIIQEWYGDEHGAKRAALFKSGVTNTTHVANLGGQPTVLPFEGTEGVAQWDAFKAARTPSYVSHWFKSLPSGHPMTTTINSMYSLLVLIYAYICLVGDDRFWELVFAIVYGDDNIMAISWKVIERYNLVTIAEELAKIGIVYTASDKSQARVKWTTLEESTMLKRGFKLRGDVWVGPLSPESIGDMITYQHGSISDEEFLQQAITAVAIESAIWCGPEKDGVCEEEPWLYAVSLGEAYEQIYNKPFRSMTGHILNASARSKEQFFADACGLDEPIQMYLERPNRV